MRCCRLRHFSSTDWPTDRYERPKQMIDMPDLLVDLGPLSTDRAHCLTLTTGPIDRERLEIAEEYRFDQLPVLDPRGWLRGLIAAKQARAMLDSGTELAPTSAEIHMREVAPSMMLFELLDGLSASRAVVVRDTQRAANSEEDWFALVTISDLNRHPFRTMLYQPLVDLEVALAELIDLYFDDPWDWIVLTSDYSQVRIVGQWELEKRSSVDTHPVTGCMLSDLLNVLGKSAELREQVGYKAKGKYDKLTGGFAAFRNQVMHPVRPLILDHRDVDLFHRNVEGVMSLSAKVWSLNRDLQEELTRGIRYLP